MLGSLGTYQDGLMLVLATTGQPPAPKSSYSVQKNGPDHKFSVEFDIRSFFLGDLILPNCSHGAKYQVRVAAASHSAHLTLKLLPTSDEHTLTISARTPWWLMCKKNQHGCLYGFTCFTRMGGAYAQ